MRHIKIQLGQSYCPIACSGEPGCLCLILQGGAGQHKHTLWALLCSVNEKVCLAEMARLLVNWKVWHVSLFPVLTLTHFLPTGIMSGIQKVAQNWGLTSQESYGYYHQHSSSCAGNSHVWRMKNREAWNSKANQSFWLTWWLPAFIRDLPFLMH